jgi:superfamily II DNA or RNA helicase
MTTPNTQTPVVPEYPALYQALAAVGKPLSRMAMPELARALQLRPPDGKTWTSKSANEIVDDCAQLGYLEQVTQGYACVPSHAFAALKLSVQSGRLNEWCEPLLRFLNLIDRQQHQYGWIAASDVITGVRIAIYGNKRMHAEVLLKQLHQYSPADIFCPAFAEHIDAALIETIDEHYRQNIATHLLHGALQHPNENLVTLIDWGIGCIKGGTVTDPLKYATLKHLLWRGQFARCTQLLDGDSSQDAVLLRADAAVMQGEYARALTLYDEGVALARGEGKLKYGLMSHSSAWLRVAALVASDDPALLDTAGTLARGEAKVSNSKPLWSSLQQAIDVRRGDVLAKSLWITMSGTDMYADFTHAIVHAWLRKRFDNHGRATIERWLKVAEATRYQWLADEFRASLTLTSGGSTGPSLAAAFSQEASWQRTLGAIAALATEQPIAAEEESRIAWIISDTESAGIPNIEAWEQKRGPRGWNRGKKLSFTKLARSEQLDPNDARVAQALERVTNSVYELDRHRALRALIGHPLVFFADNFDTPAELALAEPELLVTRNGKDMQIGLLPSAKQILAAFGEIADYAGRVPVKQDRLPCLLLRQSATRAHVIALNATHRRVAKLIGEHTVVPEDGAEQLRAAIDGAARHFTVHSEIATGATETAGDVMIHAELAPHGSGLRLHLAVRPFGDLGPRYTPGRGSARVFAKIDGKSQAVLRDLHAEQSSLDTVLNALREFSVDGDTLEAQWEDPTQCLALVEALQALTAEVRIEWPAGIKFRISRTYTMGDMQMTLNRQQNWFTATGGLTLDGGEVIGLRRLIDAVRSNEGRFIPLGDGGFVALSDDLRRRINEISLLDESKEGPAQLPLPAAIALADATEGASLQLGEEWEATLSKIEEAQALDFELPSTLQAELRGYQLDGYKWLSRLAHWGGGACLADDMGLGKTVQTIAILLARAPHGAALVIAPTSVCQNWIDEARRFAPTLNVRLFEGADRTALIDSSGPFDVLVCSYTLLQQEVEAFAAKLWHSLVLDEAQAVKNFSTKRAQAVLSLQAAFRIAATGTPVENRLEELWMLFRFLNPGLLGSRERFNERFATPIERGDSDVRAHLRRFIAPFVLRRTKTEVLTELPPRTEIVLTIKPEPEEQAFHQALRESALNVLSDQSKPPQQRRFQVLAELMRVRRACCDPTLVAPNAKVGSAKLDAFAELVTELIANRHKALVFSQFVDYLSLLRGRLDELGIRYQYLDGSTPMADRSARVRAFQGGDGDLFLISLRAGGVGLNLTAADYVIITDPWWNPAVEDQAASRAHRMGQERPVTVYRLAMKDSIEERIMNLHAEKRALADSLFTGEEFGGAWSVEDLMQLLREEQ